MIFTDFIFVMTALVCAALIAFATTPIARVLAFKCGAVSIPKDNRRMHKKPMPLMGGVAIFAAFATSVLAFCDVSKTTLGLLAGSLLIVAVGIFDDIYCLNPFLKLGLQIIVSFVPVFSGIRIEHFNFFGKYVAFGTFSIPVTMLWIVALTNAMNLIDGLDGLSCGVSAISAVTLLVSSFFLPETPFSAILLTAILAGACIGFLPFNHNPAKIFMGDTGAMFLGFVLANIAVLGVFKANAIFSFCVPFLSFAIPIFDTFFAFVRRLAHGKNPFVADRGHIHHKLIDMGFDQKQSVTILYAISAVFGISALLFALSKPIGGAVIILSALVILLFNWVFITKSRVTREQTGLLNDEETQKDAEEANASDGEKKNEDEKSA